MVNPPSLNSSLHSAPPLHNKVNKVYCLNYQSYIPACGSHVHGHTSPCSPQRQQQAASHRQIQLDEPAITAAPGVRPHKSKSESPLRYMGKITVLSSKRNYKRYKIYKWPIFHSHVDLLEGKWDIDIHGIFRSTSPSWLNPLGLSSISTCSNSWPGTPEKDRQNRHPFLGPWPRADRRAVLANRPWLGVQT